MNLSSPVTIAANTTYVASYYAPSGHYAGDDNYFATAGVDNAPLHALGNGVDGGNGVYRYGTGGGFPTSTFQSSNYWVDVVFQPSAGDTTAPTVSATTPCRRRDRRRHHGADHRHLQRADPAGHACRSR